MTFQAVGDPPPCRSSYIFAGSTWTGNTIYNAVNGEMSERAAPAENLHVVMSVPVTTFAIKGTYMTRFLCRQLALLLAIFAISAAANAVTLKVRCGEDRGLNTIGAALQVLQHDEEIGKPKTILVSGACNENVVIQGMDRLTLNAEEGASITDASAGSKSTVFIGDSHDVALNGFTINGGFDGIRCFDGSVCRFTNNTVQNSQEAGIFILTSSYGVITGGIIQGNTKFAGIGVGNASQALVSQATIRGNLNGAVVNNRSFLHFDSSSSSGNSGVGLSAFHGSEVDCGSCTVSHNGATGIDVAIGATAVLTLDFGAQTTPPYNITANGGVGVGVADLSTVTFEVPGNVGGNNGPFDLACNPTFTTAVGLANAGLPPARTNCTGQ